MESDPGNIFSWATLDGSPPWRSRRTGVIRPQPRRTSPFAFGTRTNDVKSSNPSSFIVARSTPSDSVRKTKALFHLIHLVKCYFPARLLGRWGMVGSMIAHRPRARHSLQTQTLSRQRCFLVGRLCSAISTGCANYLLFSSDGKHIVSSSDDDHIRIWDANRDGGAFPPFAKDELGPSAVHTSPDGLHLSCDHRGIANL